MKSWISIVTKRFKDYLYRERPHHVIVGLTPARRQVSVELQP